MSREITRVVRVAGILFAAAATGLASAQNQLRNPSFEDRCTLTPGWASYGNVFLERAFPVTGLKSMKVFGPFCCPTGYSGFNQDVPTTPGEQWQASCYVTSPSSDALRWYTVGGVQYGTQFFIELQFLDADKNIVHDYGLYRSPAQRTHTFGLPIPLQSEVFTAPPGAAYVRYAATIEQLGYTNGAAFIDEVSLSNPGGPNVLQNTSFEDTNVGCLGSALKWWNNFGNGGPNNDQYARTGSTAAKLWGSYSGPVAYSGWFQDVVAAEGSQWQISGWGRTIDGSDHIADGNTVVLSIEFWNDTANISTFDTFDAPHTPAPMPTGAANNNEWAFYQSGIAIAPPGTTKVRAIVLQRQTALAGGATWWDDLELVSIDATTCYADYNQDGGVDGGDIEAFFSDWESGSSFADVNQDGGIDGGDIETFFIQWSNGGC